MLSSNSDQIGDCVQFSAFRSVEMSVRYVRKSNHCMQSDLQRTVQLSRVEARTHNADIKIESLKFITTLASSLVASVAVLPFSVQLIILPSSGLPSVTEYCVGSAA